jgi:hypothetical protein
MWWCLVATYEPVYDIQFHYTKFITNNSSLCVAPKLLPSDYHLLGYTVIVSTAMKSKLFEVLFADL